MKDYDEIQLFTAYRRKKDTLFLNSIVYILFFVSISLYLISLKGCFLSLKECALDDKLKEYFYLGMLLILSCLLFTLAILLQIASGLEKINYLIFFAIYSVIFFFNQGTDFAHHGTYNCIIFIFFFIFFFLFFFLVYSLIYLYLEYFFGLELKKLLISILILFHFILIFYLKVNCQKFYNGIGGNKLINDEKYTNCFIKKPKFCGYNLLSNLFDMSYFRRKGCKGFNDKKEKFLKYLMPDFKKFDNFSFPRTEYWDPKKSYRNLAKLVEQNIYIENINNSKNNEIFVSFQNDKGKIKILLKKNKTLIKYKRKLSKKYNVKFKNIYLIYFDALSRNHFIRKLKKSAKLIEEILYTNNKKKSNYKKYNAFQFFKYHNFNGHTPGNIFPLFYGNKMNTHTGISIVKFFNKKGFITAAAHNSCNKEIYDWHHMEQIHKNIKFSNFDHENVAMFCDPNYEDKHDKWSIIRGKNSIFRKCFYGMDSFDYNFEYILQFLEAYKKERKFFRISFGDGHESTTEVIKYIDDSFFSFMQKILNNYFDDKTAILILSDHGAHMPGPHDVLFYQEKITEKYLGLFLLIIPNSDKFNSENILFNQQQLITTYDIHDTLLDMININKYKYKNMNLEAGQSIFFKINGKERNCEKYNEEITKEFCFCENYH